MATQPEDILPAGDVSAPGDDAGGAALTEVEQLAAEMGWKPEADFTGQKDKWKEAKDYIRTERDMNRTLKNTVRSLNEKVDNMVRAGTKQTERALKRQADEINGRFQAAVENKDTKGAADAVRELRELEAEAAPDVTPADTEAQFAKDNPWYGKERKATAYAVMYAKELGDKKVPLSEQLPLIEAEVRKEFPELFAEGARKEPVNVSAPGRSTQRTKAKSFADLPSDVKAAAERHAKLAQQKFKADPEKVKAEYAADYFATQAA